MKICEKYIILNEQDHSRFCANHLINARTSCDVLYEMKLLSFFKVVSTYTIIILAYITIAYDLVVIYFESSITYFINMSFIIDNHMSLQAAFQYTSYCPEHFLPAAVIYD